MAGWWPGCCCGCRAVYRLDSSGNLIWRKDWGIAFGGTRTTALVTQLETDDNLIYVAGSKAGDDYASSFTVRQLDEDGETQWESDIGGDLVNGLLLTSDGLWVGHRASFDPADPITIQLVFASGSITSWSLYDETIGTVSSLSPSISAATLQSTLESYAPLTGKVTVSGTSIASGFTLTFDSSLAGPTGYRQVPVLGYSGSGTRRASYSCASLADITLLDETDGTISLRANVGGAGFAVGAGYFGVYDITEYGSDLLLSHDDLATGSYRRTVIDTSGSILSQGTNLVGHCGIQGAGTDSFGFSASGTAARFNSSHATSWTRFLSLDTNNIEISGSSYVWVKSTSTAYRLNQSDGTTNTSFSIGSTLTASHNAMSLLADGGIVVGRGTTGVSKYTSGGSLSWSYSDANQPGVCSMNYQSSEVLFGSTRLC